VPRLPLPFGVINSRAIKSARARRTVLPLQHAIRASVDWLGYALAPFWSVKLASANSTSRCDAVTSGRRHIGPISRQVKAQLL